jgi:hypothetical protein
LKVKALLQLWYRPQLRDILALGLIFGSILVFFKDGILAGQVYFEPDTMTYYYPVTRQLDESLRQGTLQLWNPYLFTGFPLFADGEQGAFYPLRVLFLWLLPADAAMIWLRVARFWLAGAFCYAFARQIGIRRYGALIAGLVFPLSSFMVGQLHHTNLSNTAVWLPAMLLFVERAFVGQGYRRYAAILAAGFAFGMACLGVHLQPVLLIATTTGCYSVYRAFTAPATSVPVPGFVSRWALPWRTPHLLSGYLWPRGWLAFQVISLTLATGIGLAAVQLLPLYELTRQSFRGYRQIYDFAVTFSSSPHNVITLWFPYFFRTPQDVSWSLWTHWETTIYIGIVPLALVSLAVLFSRNRNVIFFSLLGLFALLLAMGDYLPVKIYGMLFQLPGFSFIRAPGRFLLLFAFPGAILAGYGAQWLASHLEPKGGPALLRARRLVLLSAGGWIGLGAIFWMVFVWSREWLLSHKGDTAAWLAENYLNLLRGNYQLNTDMAYQGMLYNLDLANPRTQATFIFIGLLVTLLLLWSGWPRFHLVWQTALVVTIAADLLFFAVQFHPLISIPSLTWPTPAGRFLIDNNGPHRVYARWPGVGPENNRLMPYEVATVTGYSSLKPERHRELLRSLEQGNTRLLELMGVRYILDTKDIKMWQEAGYRTVFEDSEVRIYENTRMLPRAMLLPSVVIARPMISSLELMNDPKLDLTKVGVLGEAQGAWLDNRIRSIHMPISHLEEAANHPAPGTANILVNEPHRIVIQTSGTADSMLLLTNSYHSGWRAYTDGIPDKVFLADHVFKGVFVAKGSHTVELIFDPISFKVGAGISIATVLGLLMFILFGWRRGILAV